MSAGGGMFCPLAVLADLGRVPTFVARGQLPREKELAVQALLDFHGTHPAVTGLANALWLLLIPYGFSAVPPMPDDVLRRALARACDVRSAALLADCPEAEVAHSTALHTALLVLRASARELVAEYDYDAMRYGPGSVAAALMLATAARAELAAAGTEHATAMPVDEAPLDDDAAAADA